MVVGALAVAYSGEKLTSTISIWKINRKLWDENPRLSPYPIVKDITPLR
jgi:hypothetical protein